MKVPPGYKTPPNSVCKLNKSIYGLKKASRQWFSKLSQTLIPDGFIQSLSDNSLFIKKTNNIFLAILIYVDDIVVASNNDNVISHFKTYLHDKFKLKDLGTIRFFLGLEVGRTKKGISVSQRPFTLQLLQDTGYIGAKPVSTPMETNLKLSKDKGNLLPDPTAYRSLIGKLIYLTITRPDISYAVSHLSQFLTCPRVPHLHDAHRILQYLKSTPGQGIFFPSNTTATISAYAETSLSPSNVQVSFFFGCRLEGLSRHKAINFWLLSLPWQLPHVMEIKKQQTVSRSSAEAEYRAMANSTSELTWIIALLKDFGVNLATPELLYCDNTAAIHISENPVYHERTKHVEIDCHFIREKVQQGSIKLLHVSSQNNLADVFTKALLPTHFSNIISKMGLINMYTPS
uniref:Reverse transcriptase Ty1/copia-type domain-containing protein n=1 Tax=Cannabis sativa TaxID=3483 RepID=A0A803PSX6_CANSA